MIRASPDRIFAHIGRIDYLPRYGAPLWMAAEPAEKHRSGQLVTLTGYLIGLPVEAVLRIVLRPPHTLEFKQVRGTLRAFSGQCTLRAVEGGTEVHYRLEADPGITMISDEATRQFLVQFVERMLDRIKLAAERRPPVRRGERAGAAAASGLDVEDDVEPEHEDAGTPGAAAERAVAAAPPGAAAEGGGAAAPRGPAVPSEMRPSPGRIPPSSADEPAVPAGPGRAGPSRSGKRRRRRHRGRARPHGGDGTRAR